MSSKPFATKHLIAQQTAIIKANNIYLQGILKSTSVETAYGMEYFFSLKNNLPIYVM